MNYSFPSIHSSPNHYNQFEEARNFEFEVPSLYRMTRDAVSKFAVEWLRMAGNYFSSIWLSPKVKAKVQQTVKDAENAHGEKREEKKNLETSGVEARGVEESEKIETGSAEDKVEAELKEFEEEAATEGVEAKPETPKWNPLHDKVVALRSLIKMRSLTQAAIVQFDKYVFQSEMNKNLCVLEPQLLHKTSSAKKFLQTKPDSRITERAPVTPGTPEAPLPLIFVPLILKGMFMDHIVGVVIDRENNRIEYYDSKGLTIKDRTAKLICEGSGDESIDLEETIVAIAKKYISPDKLGTTTLWENKTKHQYDSYNCGVYVLDYFLRRTQGRSAEEIEKKGMPFVDAYDYRRRELVKLMVDSTVKVTPQENRTQTSVTVEGEDSEFQLIN